MQASLEKFSHEVDTQVRRFQCNLFQHSVESFGSIPLEALQQDLEAAEKTYMAAREKREPYYISIYNKVGEEKYVKLERIGFFTDLGMEVAIVLDDNSDEIRMGTIPINEDSISLSTDLHITLPRSAVNPELNYWHGLQKKMVGFMDNMHSRMKRYPEFRFEIHDSMRKFRNEITDTKSK